MEGFRGLISLVDGDALAITLCRSRCARLPTPEPGGAMAPSRKRSPNRNRRRCRTILRSWPPRVPQTRYAQTRDGVSIAYQTWGSGPIPLLIVHAWISQIEVYWEWRLPDVGHYAGQLSG